MAEKIELELTVDYVKDIQILQIHTDKNVTLDAENYYRITLDN